MACRNTPWSVEADRQVWMALGACPRTAGGYLQSTPYSKSTVSQLAQQFGRTEGAVKSRVKQAWDDPTHPMRAAQGCNNPALISAPSYTLSPGQSVGRSASSQQSAAGWRSWPVVRSGDWGQVYVSSENRFGYYDDEEDEDEAIVYFGAPLSGDGPYVYPRSALRQPPFDGKFVSMGQPSASEKFGPSATGVLAALAMFPGRGETKFVSLTMLREGMSIAQVAAARSLQASTIETHVADLYKDGLCDEALLLMGLTPAIRAEIRAINANLTGEDVGKLKPIKERCVHGYGLVRLALV